jgi:hypothetical protein
MSGETQKERQDRELIELLNELRVALPGVQVLFAFLLTVPFTERFAGLSSLQQAIYYGTFLATTGAAVLLMAPTTYHRIRFREGDKERMLQTASRFAIAGAVLLAVAIVGVALLVTDVLYRGAFAILIASAVLAMLAWCWFGLPLTRKASSVKAG